MKNIIVLLILLVFSKISFADSLVKPSPDINPIDVVEVQLFALQSNDENDFGIKQTWEFAHPKNQKNTGPIEKFTNMIKGNSYKMLLNHLEHKIVEKQLSNLIASYEVTVLDENKTYYKFY